MSIFNPKAKDTDFMSELEAAHHMRPNKAAILLFISIIALVTCLFFWSAVAKVEEITRAQGSVVPSQDVQVVQSLEGGVLEALLVREGQQVKKGDILMRISDVQFASQERGTEARSLSLRAKKARLEAEARGLDFKLPQEVLDKTPQIAANEKSLYESRQNELNNTYAILDDRISKASAELAETNAQITRFSNSKSLLGKELEITKEMVRKRAVPKIEEIRLTREISDLTGQINANVQRRRALQAEVDVTKKERASQLDKFQSQALGELNQIETEISGLKENLASIGDRVDRAELRAPVDGTVNRIAIKTIGGVIEPAARLVEIIPLDDELKIIAKVKPNEIAFIRPGQPAKVKITAYDPQKYGALKGELVRIGAGSVTDSQGTAFFEIEVRTVKNHMGDADNPLPITAGMVADVEIITGKRTILEYMMKPILRGKNRVFTER
ncbi:MAG: HlyD family type I secretion periplasmic adaptor subunit [Alphaproteobacteria bacterium]|nr:HlyD family type I secretion periplasmic adaptor subunit [Alphaproteobacteria bacterium]